MKFQSIGTQFLGDLVGCRKEGKWCKGSPEGRICGWCGGSEESVSMLSVHISTGWIPGSREVGQMKW